MNRISPDLLQSGVCLWVDFPEWGAPLFFSRPLEILVAHHPGAVRQTLRDAEAAARAGRWVGGFLSYEAAAAFDGPVVPPAADGVPLAWFALFDPPREATYPALASGPLSSCSPPVPAISNLRYRQDLAAIATAIGAGESYQVNYTIPTHLAPGVDPATLFLRLQSAHRFPRALWMRTPEWAVASLSPETFLQKQGNLLATAPIKGTRPRGGDPERDQALGAELEAAEKDRAEHVMIVDMARNDLGRICRTGSVGVAPFLARRHFSTVHHLESWVHGEARPGVGLEEA
ncbi:MAG: chorismate-binding protein, partial [Magnetococcales bacterium]|nr:chorismate-binding protein [Magnetococcales bacterium]